MMNRIITAPPPGGGHNHRMGLFDMMMIKDNHIAAAGGIKAAVQRADEYIESNGLQVGPTHCGKGN